MLLIEPPKLLIGSLVEEDRELQRRLRHREEQKRWKQNHPEQARLITKSWCQRHPEIRREYQKQYCLRHPENRRAGKERYRIKHREQLNAAQRRRYYQKRSIKVITQSPDDILKRVYASLSSGLPRFIKDDVAGEMLLAVLEGKLLVEDIGRSVDEFTKRYNRQFDAFKMVSLDGPIVGTDLRRIDLLVAE